MNRLFFLFALMLIWVSSADAQSFTASVNTTKIPVGEQLEIDFVFAAQDINGISDFKAPPIKDFVLLSGPNRSTNMQFINGQVSASTGFSYILQARVQGKYTIGSATIQYKGQTFRTQPIIIEVVQGNPQSKKPDNKEDVEVDEKEIAENLFIRATADKSQCVVGEQVTVLYKLFVRLNISSPEISKIPSYQGAWAEELETADQNSRFVNEVINGKMYKTLLLKKVAVFPTQTGEITLTPYELLVPVMIERKKKQSRNWFDDFFDDPFSRQVQTVQFKARSNTLKLISKPLPITQDPSFTGAVGKFTVTAELDKQQVKENDPVNLTVRISGSGNIQLLKLPVLILPAGFEQFEPKETDDIVKGVPLSGKKSYEFLLIPRTNGKLEIPAITFSYYNPDKKIIESSVTAPLQLVVSPVDNSGGVTEKNTANNFSEKDIRYIKLSPTVDPNMTPVFQSFWYWSIWILFTVVFSSVVVVKRKQISLQNDIAKLKNSRAKKLAGKRLKTAAGFLANNDRDNFYTSLSAGLQGYIEDKFLIPKSEFALDTILRTLQNRGLSTALLQEIEEISKHCDFIRFAPSQGSATDMKTTLQRASDLIIKFEQETA